LAGAGLEDAASRIIASSNVSRRSPAATGITGNSTLDCFRASSIVELPLVSEAAGRGFSSTLAAWNFMAHFGHFNRRPWAWVGRLSTTPQ
jgi:hypothetical protein